MNREMKTFFGVSLLTVFSLLMINHLVLAHPVGEWGLAGAMFALGAFFTVWASLPEGEAETSEMVVSESDMPKAQEWLISKSVGADGKAQVKVTEGDALPFDELTEGEAHA